MLLRRNRHPYFRARRIPAATVVFCGRCESAFEVALKRGRNHPRVICPKCGVENRLKIVWK